MKGTNVTDRVVNGALYCFTGLAFAFIFVPVIVLIAFSFSDDRIPTLPWSGASLRWYRALAEDGRILESAINTLYVGVSTSVIATALGVSGAYCLYRWNFPGKALYYTIVAAPPCSPLLVLGLSLLLFLNLIGIGSGLTSVIIGHSVLAAPFAMALASLRLAQMDRSLEETSWNLGYGEFATIRKVVLPQLAPTIAACLALTMALSADEFVISWFVSGLDTTLPVRIFTMMSGAVSPRVNAIGTLVFLTSQILFVVAAIFASRSFSRKSVG